MGYNFSLLVCFDAFKVWWCFKQRCDVEVFIFFWIIIFLQIHTLKSTFKCRIKKIPRKQHCLLYWNINLHIKYICNCLVFIIYIYSHIWPRLTNSAQPRWFRHRRYLLLAVMLDVKYKLVCVQVDDWTIWDYNHLLLNQMIL